jgi:hypothetical protein
VILSSDLLQQPLPPLLPLPRGAAATSSAVQASACARQCTWQMCRQALPYVLQNKRQQHAGGYAACVDTPKVLLTYTNWHCVDMSLNSTLSAHAVHRQPVLTVCVFPA